MKKEPINALTYSDTLKVNQIYSFKSQVEIFNPFKILNVNNDYLIVSELRKNDFFHIFSLPDLKYLFTAGRNGKGPNEFMVPPTYIGVNKNGFEVYDPILERLRFFSINTDSMVEIKNISLGYKGQMGPLNRPKRINDSTYFADYGTSVENTNNEYIALKPADDKSLFTFGKYPPSDLENFDRYSHFLKTNASRKNGNQFAAFYIYHNRFKIYDGKGKKLIDFTINDPNIQVNSNSASKYMYKVISQATEDYIYLLGVYNPEDKIYDNPDAKLKTSIEVWSWDGKPIYRASFDRLIHGFTVSEDYKKIYGFSYLNESTIFEYNLNLPGL